MNIKILLFALSAAAISSCNSAYRSTQTPDDVYYSKGKVVEEDDRTEKENKEARRESYKDRQVGMCVYDRRWRDFDDDYDYRYDPYRYGYSYGYYYNPYYCHYPVYITNVPIANPKNTVPRMTNLGSYNNTTYAVVNTKTGTSIYTAPPRQYNNSNNNSNLVRRILNSPQPVYNNNNSSNNNSNNSTEQNTNRTYTPSSSNSSSGSSSSGSSGGSVSRPGRGG